MFFSNYSGNTLYESYFLVMYNSLYTSVPVMVHAILEQNIPSEKLISKPSLYKNNRNNSLMSHNYLIKWTGLGLWHSMTTFFVFYFLFNTSQTDWLSLQTAVAQAVTVVVNVKLLLESKHWNLPLILSIVLSILCFTLLTVVSQVYCCNYRVSHSVFFFYGTPCILK